MIDYDRKTKGGASSEPAFRCESGVPEVRGQFGLTGEFQAVVQIDRGQGGAPLQNNNVT